MLLFLNILELSPLYVSAFWGLTFILSPVKENQARFVLGIFMISATVFYFSHALYFDGDYELYKKIDVLYVFSRLSAYPLYYIYIRLLTRDIHFRTSNLWHLSPALFVAALQGISFLIASEEEREIYLNSVLIREAWPGHEASIIVKLMASVYFIGLIIFGIQVITYLLLGIDLLRKYNKRIADFYSNLEGKRLFWIELLTISLLVAAFTSTTVNLLGRNFFADKDLLVIPSAMFGLLLFIIGLLGNKQDQIIKTVVFDENKCQGQKEPTEFKYGLKEKMLLILDQEKLFLDPNIRIISLTFRLSTNRTYLSKLINTEFGMSFSDFVNQHRVKHAKMMMDADRELNYSLNHFSEESGFGSISSFNRAFKQFEGVTAGAYRKKIIKRA